MVNVVDFPPQDAGLETLDAQMSAFTAELSTHVGVHTPRSKQLATTVAQDVASLGPDARDDLLSFGNVTAQDRLDELVCFQAFMDRCRGESPDPALSRAQVIVQNYVCFVYLGDSCFKSLKRLLPSGSVGRKCSTFLTNNPVRAFRNAVAHANWRYLPEYRGLEYWARKGSDPNEPSVRWEVSGEALFFWQALARSVAYATYLTLIPPPPNTSLHRTRFARR